MTRAESESSEAHDVGPVAPEGWWFVGDQRLGSTQNGGETRGKTVEPQKRETANSYCWMFVWEVQYLFPAGWFFC